ncbi:protamine-like [Odontomachus brunneus]|uniref:protamine-like n=1 Tax=Odontomachus brunneus TaxID=486640 RepID=UPI0013F221D2|nr:protamine-like [Odontomachus brunneus]
MDDSTSDNGRRIFNEPRKEMDELMEENEDDDAKTVRRMDRRRRRAERRSNCQCRPRARSRRRRKRRIVSQNPFIIFYLEMYFKSPGKRVAEVAREAGKIWSNMSDEDRKQYVELAEKERMRRCRMMRRRGAR